MKRVPSSSVQRIDRADGDAPVAGEPAEDQHRVGEEGDDRLEVGRVDGRQVEREEEAGDARRARPRSPATGACRRSAFLPSARAASSSSRIARSTRPQGVFWVQPQGDGDDQHRDDPDDEQQRAQRLGVASSRGPGASPSIVSETSIQVSSKHLKSSLQKKPWLPPVRPRAFWRDEADDLGAGDRRDREVVGAQAQRRQPDEQAEARSRSGSRAAARARTTMPAVDGQDRHRVGADRHEPGLAEVDDPGEADVELQAEREDARRCPARIPTLVQKPMSVSDSKVTASGRAAIGSSI